MKNDDAANLRVRLIAISCSLLVGLALMALKFYVYSITQSSAILSDALESIINVTASAFALGSIVLAAKPPDSGHPYGHGKIEYFSAGFEGALIIFAAFGIVWTAVPQILTPHPLPHLQSGLLILLGTSVVNYILGLGLLRAGKAARSLALTADGKHVLTDVYTSAGVLIGLLLVQLSGWYWLDGGIALLVAVNILIIGARLVRAAVAGLMDTSDPDLLRDLTQLLARRRKCVWIDIHRLRAIRSGDRIRLDFHLTLPRDMSLAEVHQEVTELETIIKAHLPGRTEALIHTQPCRGDECSICGYDPCELRQQPVECRLLWHCATLTRDHEELIEVAADGGRTRPSREHP